MTKPLTNAQLQIQLSEARSALQTLHTRINEMDQEYDDLLKKVKLSDAEQKIKRMKLKRRIRRLTRGMDMACNNLIDLANNDGKHKGSLLSFAEALAALSEEFGSK